MSYQVIARKWRPGLFEEVVGQDHVVRTLTNAVASGRIGHAYLFSGPRGVGKTTVARILAKCLNCKAGPTPAPCNSCEMCASVAAGSAVDVLEIDGASNTSVDNIRELRESVRYAPSFCRYKVYIIDEVHMLSDSAFNALLKTLEEPPPHVVFIFATTEPHKIPLTIHSRCQRFDFRRIPLKKIHAHLSLIAEKEGIKIEEEALYLITRESEGSLRDAQSLLEQVVSFQPTSLAGQPAGFAGGGAGVKASDVSDALGLMDRSVVYDLTSAVLKKDAGECLNMVEKMHNFGYDLKRATVELLEHIRDIAVIKVSGDLSLVDLPESEAVRLKALADGCELERLERLFSILTRGYEEVVKSSTPRFSFEMALLRASHPEDAKPAARPPASTANQRASQANQTTSTASKVEGLKETSGRPVVPAGQHKAVSAELYKTANQPASTAIPLTVEETPSAGAECRSSSMSGVVQGLLNYIKEKDKRIYKSLESAAISLKGKSPDIAVDISVTADRAGFFILKKEAIEGMCGDYLKGRVTVEIIKSGESKDAGVNAQQTGPSAGKPQAADPLLKETLGTLGGRVIEERRRE
ncbi:MAG: DNA polymerase III subunit gamma/tau [Deltaproteobacteria bacterium]|nr:DNA polymerase III subunit gamma/tau [Deltaproteobacteria bacterium]